MDTDGTRVVVQAAGQGFDVVTYTVAANQPWINAANTFSNRGATATVWIGDAIDYGGPGQRSGVAGHGTIFSAYGNGNWMASRRSVTVAAGESWTLIRRIAALATSGDPWAPLADL